MKVFLQVKRLENVFTGTCLNLKHTEKKYDNIRKHHGNGRSDPCPTPHCIKMFNILFKNLQIGMKIHIWIAKWFLTIQIRTIPYYWKSWLQYILCPRIFRTTGGKVKRRYLKLYCGYNYTKSCMINRIWGLKQLWLQVNDHAWFHLQWLRWPVRNGKGAKSSKWKHMSPARLEPTPRQSTTGKSVP